jgi:hypothetical protein
VRTALGAAARDKSPYHQYEHCAHNAGDEACSLPSVIPADGLSEVGRDQGTDNAEGGSESARVCAMFLSASARMEAGT